MFNTTWFFLNKTSSTISNHLINQPKGLLSTNEIDFLFFKKYGLLDLTKNFVEVYCSFKNITYETALKLKFYRSFSLFSVKHKKIMNFANNIIILDFSRKQLYTTQTNLNQRVLYTTTNGSFLQKTPLQFLGLKKTFQLKKNFLFFFFLKVLKLKNKQTNLILKGCSNDLFLFFQRLDRSDLTQYFNYIFLNFLGGYNLNKKKRVRSIKKRFKKQFLKYENKILKKTLKL